MSTAYEIVTHPRAAEELEAIPTGTRERLTDLITEMAQTREPWTLTKVTRLSGRDGMLRAKVGSHRAILARDGPQLKLLLVDHREPVYDRLDIAERRRDE